nr:putative reverse transcriptase domain-containing protein [Tanacetum cinerariifolium]
MWVTSSRRLSCLIKTHRKISYSKWPLGTNPNSGLRYTIRLLSLQLNISILNLKLIGVHQTGLRVQVVVPALLLVPHPLSPSPDLLLRHIQASDEPKEDLVEEPKPLAGHGDQFDAHPNPQPGNMNSWVDDDDDDVEEEEDEENKDVDMEEDDDAEIISPYEVQGDQTLSPRDESSDSNSEPEAKEADDEPEAEDADDEPEAEDADDEPEAEGADVELEAEEPDGVPEAVIGADSQRPFAIRGLAPWALRRDLEALRGHERIREAESETSRTEIALGTGPTVPELTGCTYATFINCDPLPFNGTEVAIGLCQWFERLESVFQISECKEKDRVKFAMATLRGRALT